jgi:hypothetical protein
MPEHHNFLLQSRPKRDLGVPSRSTWLQRTAADLSELPLAGEKSMTAPILTTWATSHELIAIFRIHKEPISLSIRTSSGEEK